MCGLLGPCFKTGHLKPFDTNAAGTLYLKAQRSPTSAHAQSVKRPRYTSRKCRVLENKIRNRPKPGRTPKRCSNLGKIAIPLVALAITGEFSELAHLVTQPQDLLDSYTMAVRTLILRKRRIQVLVMQWFQVLFNSLFKVLFIFPSRYLFAIGLEKIFSFR